MSDQSQPIRTIPGGEHGSQAAQADAQRAIPLPEKSFFRPSERPSEPVQAGISLGPGPGPEVIGDDTDMVRAAYLQYPSESLRRVLEFRDVTQQSRG